MRSRALFVSLTLISGSWAADQREQFETQVRPLLAKNCWGCHRQTAMGGLRLDSRESILKGGKSGPAITPSRPAESLLIQAVTHRHERLRMPPAGKLPDAEIAILTAWVAQGAYWPPDDAAAAPAAKSGEYQITAEQRAFWAFQPVKVPALPVVRNAAWSKSPIDRFILAALEARKLKPVDAADRRTLIRRASFDLTGLPPAPEQVDAFLQDKSPDSFARVIDRLLASPQYGERWGRYWLDVARYSDDSMGSTLNEPVYPNSFRYRNWVIGAFNQDMPYNLFVKAQIAGDTLPASDPSQYAAGLGFFSLSPEMQDDRVDAVTRGFLALTVACAQCHDHKFDPIPTKDFYSIQSIFTNTQLHETPLAPKDVVDAWQAQNAKLEKQQKRIDTFYETQREQLGAVLASSTAHFLLAVAGIEPDAGLDADALDRWRKYLKEPRKDHPFLKPWFDAVAAKAPPETLRKIAAQFQDSVIAVIDEKSEVDEKNRIALGLNPDRNTNVNTALDSLPRDRYILWRDLFEKSSKDSAGFFQVPDGVYYCSNKKIAGLLEGVWKQYLNTQQEELKRLKAELPPKYPFLQTIQDKPKIAEGRVQIRGDRNNLGDPAPRRFLAILSPGEQRAFTKGSGRQELADAIADPKNPLTARVMVNRVWQHHFGRGLVGTASNFGQMGDRPTHPELLDWLAAAFIEHGWSLKWLHREIMLSAVYQLSAAGDAGNEATDAQNLYLWRANRQRLDAEALRDSVLSAAGTLDTTPADAAKPLDEKNHKRTVYGFISRRRMDSMLALFDFPNPNATSEGRVVTNVPLQRLFFMNSAFIESAATALADRFSGTPEQRIRAMYRVAFSRLPDAKELQLGLAYTAKSSWPSYARALLSSNEFTFVD